MDPVVDLSGVLSVVSADCMSAGARARLAQKVEPGAEKARPKLLAFANPDDTSALVWALYLNSMVRALKLTNIISLVTLIFESLSV